MVDGWMDGWMGGLLGRGSEGMLDGEGRTYVPCMRVWACVRACVRDADILERAGWLRVGGRGRDG